MADRESAFESDGAVSAGRSTEAGARQVTRSDPSSESLPRALLPDRDPAVERDRVRSFLAERVDAAAADGVVVNMSGGLDSTVTAALAVEALGPERVYGLILPCNKVGAPHARDAEALAAALGIEHDTVHLQPLFAQFGAVVPDRFDLHDEPVRSGNAVARLRMTVAYLATNATNRLVCGTANRSELLLGYLTKHGDGAADVFPLGHLYKSGVRALAAELDVPEFVVEKPPTAGFLPGQRDADDLGAPYEVVDPVLHLGVDRGLDSESVAERIAATVAEVDRTADDDGGEGSAAAVLAGIDRDLVADLLARHRATAHKRLPPPTPDGDME
ncbi:NAD(+) synthase [Halorubrum ezzemoulense]|uniref:NAD(+) synthase n=1 Tax=Halorubrum ezzemoulense TaxID=337243 RepID=UPI00232D4E4A|nr:NAD(+) synthase [Halorubrum ezzemoulense]MDB9249924.1 NAD(+) synthase [Halorubrum ezzemoulense]MDB9259949.1 NAD(+) synthase [Halorubrum ezzemoulense]MDB9263504.1 NAD(+) synthase [Halorubrum ezzemoulense]MDB9266969.1 NAD(+) synthase [Halorubrum ezzemoulense]MDB9270310.1 NAD(+) synthase [Halorubrum ezzemoulense]